MRVKLALLPLLLLTACATDPLEVQVVEIDAPAVSDGLTPAEQPAAVLAAGEELQLAPASEELSVKLSYRLAEADAAAEILVQGRFPLAIPDLGVPTENDQQKLRPTASPGVWQDLDLTFLPAGEDHPAMIASLYLNGNLVYYQQPLSDVATAPGPTVLRVEQGQVEVADVRYGSQAGKVSTVNPNGSVTLNIPLMRYAYYELDEGQEEVADYAALTPVKTGFTNRFDVRNLIERGTDFALTFDGRFAVPLAGDYTFKVRTPTVAQLYIDGERVYAQTADPYSIRQDGDATVNLSEGDHSLRFVYLQPRNWNYLQMVYRDPSGTDHLFHDMTNASDIALPGAADALVVETDEQPYLLRSFMLFPQPRVYQEGRKLTHVISVGEGQGPHYSLDLNSGALLLGWRGAFLNVHEMWNGRGEPQTATPLGPAISLDARPQWAELSGEGQRWPDSLEVGQWTHRRYELDERERPTFYYELDGHPVSDRLSPGPDGLTRTLSNDGGDALYTQLASATTITETGPGEFELKGPGAKLSILNNDGNALVLQRGAGRARLLSRVAPGSSVTYVLNW